MTQELRDLDAHVHQEVMGVTVKMVRAKGETNAYPVHSNNPAPQVAGSGTGSATSHLPCATNCHPTCSTPSPAAPTATTTAPPQWATLHPRPPRTRQEAETMPKYKVGDYVTKAVAIAADAIMRVTEIDQQTDPQHYGTLYLCEWNWDPASHNTAGWFAEHELNPAPPPRPYP